MTEPGQRLSFGESWLADGLLAQALEALVNAGDARKLGLVQADGSPESAAQAVRTMVARNYRLSFSRTTILFSALAVEAAVNFYIAVRIPRYTDTLESLDMAKKLEVASALTNDGLTLSRGEVPLSDAIRLAKLRNRIVHPKVGRGKDDVAGERAHADLNVDEAARALIGAARVLILLDDTLGPDDWLFTNAARIIISREDALRRWGREWKDSLPGRQTELARLLSDQREETLNAD